jgi:hypothetical protein
MRMRERQREREREYSQIIAYLTQKYSLLLINNILHKAGSGGAYL